VIVTIDSGILVRATVRSRGPARRLLGIIAGDPSHELALSPFILAEVGKALSYPHMQRVLGITPDEIGEHVEYLRAVSKIVQPGVGLPIVLTDPQDDPIIYTAVSAGANILRTRDRAFYSPNVTAFCKRFAIDVMNEIELLARLQA
jgi:putative PIN family toxin of toxin-antitoxin system